MCYKRPGPRCSGHALQALQAALKKGDEDAIIKARRDYSFTPRGIAELRAKGNEELADQCQARRDALIAAYTESMERDELSKELEQRLSSDEFQALRVRRDQADAKYEAQSTVVQGFNESGATPEQIREQKAMLKDAYLNMLVARQELDQYKNETAHLAGRISDRLSAHFEEYDENMLGNMQRLEEYPSNSREWLKQRQSGIGGSDVGAILKVDPDYARSNYERVLDSKIVDYDAMEDSEFHVTEEEENRAVHNAMERGDAWEAVLANSFAQKNPDLKVLHSKATWADQDDPMLRANFDGLLSSNGETPDGILEIKTAANADKWVNGVPAGYRAQTLWYLETTGLDYAYVAVQIDDNEYRQYKINRGEEIAPGKGTIQDNMPALREFMTKAEKIKAGELPRTQKRAPHPKVTAKNQPAAIQTIAAYGNRSEEEVSRSIQARMDAGANVHDATHAEMRDTPLRGDKVFIDLEATSFSPTTGDIIEVGWTRRNERNEVTDEGSVLYSPDPRILKTKGTGASDVHGITPQDVAGKPHFSDPANQARLKEAFSGATLVAHNASYENAFLAQELDQYRDGGSQPILDTQQVSKFFGSGPSNTLEDFSKSNNVDYVDAHRALNDSNMTADALFNFSQRA